MLKSFTFRLFLIISFIPSLLIAQSWQEVVQLQDTTPQKFAQMGYSVDIDNNIAIVGENGNGAGQALVFEKNRKGQWLLSAVLTPSNGKKGDQFGAAVALNGTTAVVGAIWSDVKNSEGNVQKDAGALYVFEKQGDNWVETQILTTKDPHDDDQFGISIDLTDEYLLAGAFWNDWDENGKKRKFDAGAAYVFSKIEGKWAQKQKLVASDRKGFELFGISVAIDGNNLAIGAYRNGFNEKGKNYVEFAGAAYVFSLDELGLFKEKQKILANDRAAGASFGYALDIYENTLLVGAQENKTDATNANPLESSGAAYIFENKGEGWVQSQKIVAKDRQKEAFFGEALSLDGNKAIIGAWGQKMDAAGLNALDTAGALYLFEKVGSEWSQKNKLVNTDREVGDQIGISVDISGNNVISGAWGQDAQINDSTKTPWAGAAYIFTNCEKPSITASASSPSVIRGDQVILSAEGAQYFQWSDGISNNVSFSPNRSQTFYVIGRNPDGCYSKDSVTVTVTVPFVEAISKKSTQSIIRKIETKPAVNYALVDVGGDILATQTESEVETFEGASIVATLKDSNGKPLSDMSVLLRDMRGTVIATGKTNQLGISKFDGLDPSKEYETVLDKNDPKLQTEVTKNGKNIQMSKEEILDKIGSYAILSKLKYENTEDPVSDVYVLLLDNNGYVLKKGKTNIDGQVHFENLEKSQSYQVIIDKNHPEIQVDALHNGKIVTVDSKKILEKFSKLKVLSKIEYATSDEPAGEIPVFLLDENGLVLKKGTTNSEGVAMFDLPADNKKYTVVVDKKQLALNKAIKLKANGQFERIFFDFNSAFIRSEDEEVVKNVASFLSSNPDKSLKIIAHTDNVGDYEFNKELSRLRGLAVKELLLQRGVEPSQLIVEAIGMDDPLYSNDQEIGRQINRRVEFDIL